MEFKIGDRVKLNPNKRQGSSTLSRVSLEQEFTIMDICQPSVLCCTVRINSSSTWNIPLFDVMKVGKKCK